MAEVHPEEDSKGGGPTPVKCAQCGKILGEKPYMMTINIQNTQTGFSGIISAPMCDIKCAEKYKDMVVSMMMNGKLGTGS